MGKQAMRRAPGVCVVASTTCERVRCLALRAEHVCWSRSGAREYVQRRVCLCGACAVVCVCDDVRVWMCVQCVSGGVATAVYTHPHVRVAGRLRRVYLANKKKLV